MTSCKPFNITHVIWDFDGVLIDSEQVYSDVNNKMLTKYGKTFTLEMKIAMMGTKKTDAVAMLLKMSGLHDKITVDEYMKPYDEELDRSLTDCPELPGATKLIDYFFANNIPMAVCTGSSDHEFQIKTNKHYKHWLNKIPVVVTSGTDPEVKQGKPAPDPYLITMKRMNNTPVNSKNVLVFEDSINGAKSAIAAGCNCIMIPQRQFLNKAGLDELEQLKPKLIEILNSLKDFDPIKYNLPPF